MHLCPAQWYRTGRRGTGCHIARRAHSPKVAGSNPAPATNEVPGQRPLPRDRGGGLSGVFHQFLYRDFYCAARHAPMTRADAQVRSGGTPRRTTAYPRPARNCLGERIVDRRVASVVRWGAAALHPVRTPWDLAKPLRGVPSHDAEGDVDARKRREEGQAVVRRRVRWHRSGDGQVPPPMGARGHPARRRREAARRPRQAKPPGNTVVSEKVTLACLPPRQVVAGTGTASAAKHTTRTAATSSVTSCLPSEQYRSTS